jgi:hypothetical protein
MPFSPLFAALSADPLGIRPSLRIRIMLGVFAALIGFTACERLVEPKVDAASAQPRAAMTSATTATAAPSPSIMWKNNGDHVVLWTMNGTTVTGQVDLGNLPRGFMESGFQITGAADFTGDGQADIVLEEFSSRLRMIWRMNGFVPQETILIGQREPPPYPSPDWHIAGVADFTGDGQADLLWDNWRTGQIGYWPMSGTNPVRMVSIGYVPVETNPCAAALLVSTDPTGVPWRAVTAADLTADGTPDVLFENICTGERAMWRMDGPQHLAGFLSWGIVPLSWRISGAADFTGDGQPDVLWHNDDTGVTGIWTMSGTTTTSFVHFGYAPIQWKVYETFPAPTPAP